MPQNDPKPKSAADKASARTQKREAFKREQEREAKRRRRFWWIFSAVGVVAVGALIASVVVWGANNAAENEANATTPIEGLETFTNTANHVQGSVDYAQTPPAGGDHAQVWLNCGVYSEPVPNENAVHDLEHGAVWATYDPTLPQAQVDALVAALPDTYTVVSPYDGLDSPIVLSAWDAQVRIDDASDPRLKQFVAQYWQSSSAPEPGAPCTGGIDGAGKL